MYKIIIATHGNLAQGILNSSVLFCGKNKNVIFLKLDPKDDINNFKNIAEDKIKELNSENILVFTDLVGGSPNNIFLFLSKKYSLKIITGINLIMLVEAISNMNNKELTNEYINELVQIGKDGIKFMEI